jgi:adenosylcobinamide hydrolase
MGQEQERISNKRMSDERTGSERIDSERMGDERTNNERIVSERICDERTGSKQLHDRSNEAENLDRCDVNFTASTEIAASQPFRQWGLSSSAFSEQRKLSDAPNSSQRHYASSCIAGLNIRYDEPIIMMESNKLWTMMSNGVYNGGLHQATAAVNYRVSLQYDSNDPQADMVHLLDQRGLQAHHTIGFMTAAKLSHAAIGEARQEDFSLFVLATAGTSNATRAGSWRESYRGYHAGTINIFIWLDGRMSESAMVNAIMTATEAKSAALADLAIVEATNGLVATGTSTDALLLAVSQDDAYAALHQYAGTATELGSQLAQLVYATVHMAVRTQRES